MSNYTNNQTSSLHQLLSEAYTTLENMPKQTEQYWEVLCSLNKALLNAKTTSSLQSQHIDDLLLKIETQRLHSSIRYFRQRYRTTIDFVTEDNDEVDTLTQGSYYARSETKTIKDEYLSTPEHLADIARNDSHWGFPCLKDPSFEKASYRNAYHPDTGGYTAVTNYKNKDILKMDGWVMPNSDIHINHMLLIISQHLSKDIFSIDKLKLTFLKQDAVTNQQTLEVIQKYINMGESKEFFRQSRDRRERDAFYELLQTPNGRSGKYLEMQYPNLLEQKKVASIKVETWQHSYFGPSAHMTLFFQTS